MNSIINRASRSIISRAQHLGGNPMKTSSVTKNLSHQYRTKRNFHESYAVRDSVKVTFIDYLGEETVVDAEVGKNLLDVAQDNNIELEGACGGELACATCHLVFEQEMYDTLTEKDPEEDDMLDMAMELTDTSRLGCQIHVRKDMEGMTVRIPDDGY